MKYILCYGDSNTWGYEPETARRYDFDLRWPGVVQAALGSGYHLYENALNGRTTVFDDPIEEGRCGKAGFAGVLEGAAPLDLVVIMLGTNDAKPRFGLAPWDIGWGMDLLVRYVKRAQCGRDGGEPKMLIVSPPKMGGDWSGTLLGKVFDDSSVRRAAALPAIYAEIAERNGVDFFDAAPYTEPGSDCVHLLPESHRRLGAAMADKIRSLV
ncbi:MAG: SGNH/GDSL hydrolase family protein [Planctomycetota bacterium]|nr:SGNH/GDSL hydrolase family protein [Planctomycetota bacterium]